MSDSLGPALAIILEIISVAIGLYAVYWAFSIRRALVGRIYRNHALWLGALCISFIVVSISTNSTNPILYAIGGIAIFIAFPVLFAFIDSTIRVARRSDPLLRGILRWEKLRIAVWAEVVVLEIFEILSTVYPNFGNSDLGNLLWAILAPFPFVVGGPALLIGARRSRDPVLRGSLKWIGAAILLIVARILEGSIPQFTGLYADILGAALGIAIFYAFYRSARSLAPINRLQPIEPETTFPVAIAGS